jgi:type II secretory pathway pseudopilin PulG
MRVTRNPRQPAFTLMETVIAIGVLAVLITAFLAVFGPATQGIRRAINVQDADRLVATLEKEMGILRPGDSGNDWKTAFDKAFDWIRDAGQDELIMLYQYRGDPDNIRTDGTMDPYTGNDGIAGEDYVVQSMARLRSDPLFVEDLGALSGRVFGVRTQQLVFGSDGLELGTAGEIRAMTPGDGGGGGVDSADQYPDAVIAFSAKFYALASTSEQFIGPGGQLQLDKLGKPVFTRNLGVRR